MLKRVLSGPIGAIRVPAAQHVAVEKARETDGARMVKVKLIALEQVKKLRLVRKLLVQVGVNGRFLASVLLLAAVE